MPKVRAGQRKLAKHKGASAVVIENRLEAIITRLECMHKELDKGNSLTAADRDYLEKLPTIIPAEGVSCAIAMMAKIGRVLLGSVTFFL